MRQVTGGENVRQRLARQPADSPAFGQMRFDERAVFAAQFAEGMQRLHHAGALGPAAAHARGQRHDGQFAPGKRGEAGFATVPLPAVRWRPARRRPSRP